MFSKLNERLTCLYFSRTNNRLLLTCWHQTRVGPLGLWFPSNTTMIVSATKLSHSVFRWYCSVAPEEVCCCTNRKTACAKPARANTEFPCTDGLPLQKRESEKIKMAIFIFLEVKTKRYKSEKWHLPGFCLVDFQVVATWARKHGNELQCFLWEDLQQLLLSRSNRWKFLATASPHVSILGKTASRNYAPFHITTSKQNYVITNNS